MKTIKSMISFIAVAVLSLGMMVTFAQNTRADGDIEINETNFPDDNFRNYLLSQEYGSDGKLTEAEIATVKTIYVYRASISDLKGIEYFTALDNLCCAENQLTTLDVSKNTELTDLDCSNNNLTTIDVSKNTALEYFRCEYNHLTKLDVSQNTALIGLDLTGNNLSTLDVSKNTALTDLFISNNALLTLDVSQNTALTFLSCGDNYLTTLDVSKNTSLAFFSCRHNFFTNLDVSKNTALIYFECNNNYLFTLDVSGCTALARLVCNNNDFSTLDVSGCTALEELVCNNNQLTEIDLSANNKLKKINCKNNSDLKTLWLANDPSDYSSINCDDSVKMLVLKEGEIAVSNIHFPDDEFRDYLLSQEYGSDGKLSEAEIANVKTISVDERFISSLRGIEFFTALEELRCTKNRLTTLDVSKNTALARLYCYGNQLTTLDVSKNTALAQLYCYDNQLTTLDVSKNTALAQLYCYDNQLTTLDVSKNTLLQILSCHNNPLTTLDVSKNTSLNTLYCNNNDLTTLDVSKNTLLQILSCHNNPLTTLDVSGCTALEELVCNNNQLTALDVSKNTALTSLVCFSNQLTLLDISYCPYLIIAYNEAGLGQYCNDGYILSADDTVIIHTEHTPVNVDAVPATCTKPGMEAGTKCSTCGKIFSGFDVVPATGHKWGEWNVAKKATVDSAGIETRACSVCDANETRAIAKLTPTPTTKPTVSVKLDKTTAIVVCGRTISFKATVKGTKQAVAWKSSDSKVATVDANGKISAKMAGTVTISASAAGKTSKCVVTVLYKDVADKSDFWYAPTNYLTAKGVVKGYANQTEFRPANDCTRAQMITFLYRLQGEPKTKATTCKFTDVKSSEYFYKAVIWAVEQGITTVPSDKKFNPQTVCTRAMTVTFLWRMAGKPEPKTTKNPFPDVKKTEYFYKATLWASEMKILAGLPDGTFQPQGKCLRRQMVTFLYKYDKYVNGKG